MEVTAGKSPIGSEIMARKILVVDDEPSIVTLIQYNLEQELYEVEAVGDGIEAVKRAQNNNFDFIIMDLMLPGQDGFEATKAIRKFNPDVPILMLTAKTGEIDKVMGLELGADDYLTKPFSPQELLSRMKAIWRRTDRYSKSNVKNSGASNDAGVEINLKRKIVTKNSKPIELTPNEFKLLEYLYENSGQVLSREQILNSVWGYEFGGQTRIVDLHVSHLRDKLEDDPKHPNIIRTVRGFGYEFSQR
ncbi:phoP protein [Pediococcus claussenii]|nr:phoP protein [Pediococcus claussenii]